MLRLRQIRGHQPLCNGELLLGHRFTLRATSLIHTSENKFLLNLPLIMLSIMMLIYVTILIILMLFSKQARGRPTLSLRATWCPWAPCLWPVPDCANVLVKDGGCYFRSDKPCTCNHTCTQCFLLLRSCAYLNYLEKFGFRA